MLLGAPASGKGTQAARLADHFDLEHISTGAMLRQTVANGGELGSLVGQLLKDGQLVPDNLVVELVLDALEQSGNGFVVDGFPRTLRKAEGFDVMLAQRALALTAVILIEVAHSVLVSRSTGRGIDPDTGHVYHLQFAPPPAEIVPRLEERVERLAIYQRQTAAVIDHYRERLVAIDGSGTPAQVFTQILDRLNRQ